MRIDSNAYVASNPVVIIIKKINKFKNSSKNINVHISLAKSTNDNIERLYKQHYFRIKQKLPML